jgi:hypothetical protein
VRRVRNQSISAPKNSDPCDVRDVGESNFVPSPIAPRKRVKSINQFAFDWDISRSQVYKLAKAGEVKISKILGKSVITSEAEDAFARKINEGDAA